MKNNKKLLAILLAASLMLVGCGSKKTEPTPEPTPGPTPGPTVEHQSPFVRDVAQGTLLREYKEQFDVMVDDFSSATLKGTLTGGAKNEGILRVLVDSANDDKPTSPSASIYKLGSTTFESAHPDVIGFKMRKVGNGTLSTKDLVLGLRGNDAFKVFEINLEHAFDSNNEALPELTTEWQNIEVDLGNTIEDDTTEYVVEDDGSASGVRVLDTLLGFHFFVKPTVEVSQVIEIEEVYTVKGTTKTIVDDFNHPRVDKNTTIECWWSDSTGFIVRRGVNIKGGSYEVDLPEAAAGYENLVLELNGDATGLKVNNTAVTLSPVNGAFHDFVINLEDAGITLGQKVKLEATGDLNVSAIFVSNLQEKQAVSAYPVIDIENRVVFDDFNRTQAEFIADWDTASTADYSPDPISVALSYSQGNLASVHDGVLDIKQPESGYVNVKEACPAAETPLQYLVIVAKGNLEGFRLGSTEVMWSHDWLAGAGLRSIPTDMTTYEYQKDGFVHYIIDLEEMGSDIGKDAFIDMYFNNAIQIDSIYFAKKAAAIGTSGDNLNTAASLAGYSYLGWIYVGGAYQIDLHIEGTGNLRSIRFEGGAGEFWFKDNKVIGLDGQPISDTLEFDSEHSLTISIDVAKTGWSEDAGIHVHGGGFDGSTGSITAFSYTRYYTEPFRTTPVTLASANEKAYSYLGGFAQEKGQATILEIHMIAEEAGPTLETFRVEAGDKSEVAYVNQGKLIGEDGQPFAATTAISANPLEPTILRIDLEATFGVYDGYYHIHFGGWGASEATINFSGAFYTPFTAANEIALY